MKVRLGGHGLPINSDDPFAFARAHRAFGYAAAYVPEVSIGDATRLAAIRDGFAAADVLLAEIGIWRNLIAPEAEIRRAHLDYAIERLAIADEVGALCAVSYIGSFAPGSDYTPDARNFGPEAFEAAVETARTIIDAVKPRRARFALEMMQYSLPDSVQSYVDLLRAVDRPAFVAHLDPVNLIMTPRSYFDNANLIRDCFARLGPSIVSCHAKDISLHKRAALHLDEVPIGEGVLDYGVYLAEIARLPHEVPLMLEHLAPEQYAASRDVVFAAGDRAGVAFVGRGDQ